MERECGNDERSIQVEKFHATQKSKKKKERKKKYRESLLLRTMLLCILFFFLDLFDAKEFLCILTAYHRRFS